MANNTHVSIIDSGVGNLTSVSNALGILGVSAAITSDPADLASATHLILPGVGSFGEGMEGLTNRGLIEPLTEEVLTKKKPLLGICLGMQLLASKSFEHGEHEGLRFIPGTVEEIDTSFSGLRLPHIGWNDVSIQGNHTISQGFTEDPIFYFVHSFQFLPEDDEIIAGVCEYGGSVVALLEQGNIFGAQFHPEKSHTDGLQIFKNFLDA